jgi:hypothetical protein
MGFMQSFKFYMIIIFILFVTACNNSIKYPDGGYDYPKYVSEKDTNFYNYPLKDIMSKNDSLRYSTHYLFYKQ